MRNLKDVFQRGAAEPAEEPAPERCLSCGADLRESRMYERFRVCHSCEFHYQLNAVERVALLADLATFREVDTGVSAIDPLSFRGGRSYKARIVEEQRRTHQPESALTGVASIFERDVVIAVLDFSFLGGSVGVASGERMARAFERATSRGIPVVTVISTSGTRMEEGLLALMQMPRVLTTAIAHQDAGLPHVCVLANPATGAAFATFAGIADYVMAEPSAQVGYAPISAIEEAEHGSLPPDAHTSEWMLRHGLIDAVVPRATLKESVALVLDLLANDYLLTAPRERRAHRSTHTHRGAWQLVQLSRHEKRPNAVEFIAHMTTSFVELHGDRAGEDDPSVVAGIGSLAGEAMVFVGQQRSHDGDGSGDGRISAAGFRKASRAMRLAGKFNLPLVTLIDTSGATPGLQSEASGLGVAMTECAATMLRTPSPTIAVVIGEGNSEAAAAMALADRVLMLDNAIYTVMSPERAARLAANNALSAQEAAEQLRLTSHDCLRLGVVDATVPEPDEGAHTNHAEASLLLRRGIIQALTGARRAKQSRRLRERMERYRQIGTTHSRLRGRLERRIAHLSDRIDSLLRRRWRRGSLKQDDGGIPV